MTGSHLTESKAETSLHTGTYDNTTAHEDGDCSNKIDLSDIAPECQNKKKTKTETLTSVIKMYQMKSCIQTPLQARCLQLHTYTSCATLTGAFALLTDE